MMYQYDDLNADEQVAETAQQLASLLAVLEQLRAQPLWLGEVPANANAPGID
jgi:hypothetical protein